jgi:hypothetical protein
VSKHQGGEASADAEQDRTYRLYCPEGVSVFTFQQVCENLRKDLFAHYGSKLERAYAGNVRTIVGRLPFQPSWAGGIELDSFKTVLQLFEKEQGNVSVLHDSRWAMANTYFLTSRREDGEKEVRTSFNFQIGPSRRSTKEESDGASFVRQIGSIKLQDLGRKVKKNVLGDGKWADEYQLTQRGIIEGLYYPLLETNRVPNFVVLALENAAVPQSEENPVTATDLLRCDPVSSSFAESIKCCRASIE